MVSDSIQHLAEVKELLSTINGEVARSEGAFMRTVLVSAEMISVNSTLKFWLLLSDRSTPSAEGSSPGKSQCLYGAAAGARQSQDRWPELGQELFHVAIQNAIKSLGPQVSFCLRIGCVMISRYWDLALLVGHQVVSDCNIYYGYYCVFYFPFFVLVNSFYLNSKVLF